MTKDTTITARDGGSPAKTASPGASAAPAETSKQAVSKTKAAKSKTAKPKTVKPKTAKPKTGKSKAVSKTVSKATSAAPTTAAVKKAAKAAAKAASKAKAPAKPAKVAGPKTAGSKAAGPKTAAPKPSAAKSSAAKPASRSTAAVPASATPSLGLSLQATVPAAVAVNTKLVDIAQSNVSAGLELARGLAGAKSPIEAMTLGVAYWFNHMGAVQAQARELQSLSAAWVKTATGRSQTL